MAKPKVLVLSGYGINCEMETQFAFEKFGALCEIVHINDLISKKYNVNNYQIMAFPGGFSYGDDTGAGKAFANRIINNLKDEILDFVQKDTLAIGLCNGFQIMTALGITPALNLKYGERQVALMANENGRYTCRWVHLKVTSDKCIFTKDIKTLFVPIAHGEGNFYTTDENLKKLQENDQIVFKYVDENENPANQKYPINPNGAALDIAGVCDPTGRILGMMPHPERHMCFSNRPNFTLKKEELLRQGMEIPELGEGSKIFKNAVEYFVS
jgi:phosphoribosylformylglycinamidine synthase subunit PurQ / glutaminase